jgi:H+/Cl- antiporter ClcA
MEFLAVLFGNQTIRAYVVNSSWAWPILEIVHFIGMALLVGTVGVLDMRLLGVGKRMPAAPLARLVPLGVFGFALTIISGYVFITSSPDGPLDYLSNLSFQFKTACLLLAGLNVLVFYTSGISKVAEALGAGEDAPRRAKVIAAASLGLWIAVIYFGRMLMYSDSFYLREFYPF